jgi:hypothetical protein
MRVADVGALSYQIGLMLMKLLLKVMACVTRDVIANQGIKILVRGCL